MGQSAVLISNNPCSNEAFLYCKGYILSQFILSEKVALLIFLMQSISMHYFTRIVVFAFFYLLKNREYNAETFFFTVLYSRLRIMGTLVHSSTERISRHPS